VWSKIDHDGSGSISWPEFLKYFGKGGAEDRNVTRKVSGVNTSQATKMIREKINNKMAGGPGGLRRAFQMFDRDLSGTISKVRPGIWHARTSDAHMLPRS
jgi:Ca2+-binding EF-hand superfamily protein